MDTQEFIPVDIFCRHYGVAVSFVHSLEEFGLLEVTEVDKAECLSVHQLTAAEQLVRLHNDLDINTEGIDAVVYLLQRIEMMQEEVTALRNRLRIYEGDQM